MIRVEGVERIYRRGRQDVRALRGVDLRIEAGEIVFIVGPSGSGKSTLLHLLGALDRPSGGRILFEGRDLSEMDDEEASLFRRRKLGFVFQSFNLIGTLDALQNVLMPIMPEGLTDERKTRGRDLLERVGLSDRTDHRPGELSGGEQQRVAVARAFLNEPVLILADEPTGELDSRTGREVIEAIRQMNAEQGTTILVVTHDESLVGVGDRLIRMRDGRVIEDIQGGGET